MIIQEREPIVIRDTNTNDWSAANAIIALVVIAVLGFVIYYFAMMSPSYTRIDTTTNTPAPAATTIIHDTTPMPYAVPTPTPAPLAPAPVAPPAPAPSAPVDQSNNQ